VIHQYPGVKEAAVIGVPEPRRGEQPIAFVAPNEGVELNERELILFIRVKMADYKVPRRIVIMPRCREMRRENPQDDLTE